MSILKTITKEKRKILASDRELSSFTSRKSIYLFGIKIREVDVELEFDEGDVQNNKTIGFNKKVNDNK